MSDGRARTRTTRQIWAQLSSLLREYDAAASSTRRRFKQQVSLSAPAFDAREAARALRTILNGWISQGPNVRRFETAFAAFIGRATGIAVNSGSSANLLAILALKAAHRLREGDEVIVPAATFATVAAPILQAGLVPVYVDVRRDTFNIDPEQVRLARSSRTRVLMPVHTLGYPADMLELMELAARHRWLVLEDCCEAHGASIDGRRVGSFGMIATFSFFVAHNMTTGEGGMIVTDDDHLAVVCRSLREFGRCPTRAGQQRFYSDGALGEYDRRYVFERVGYNVRMTDVAAAFGIEQLRKLPAMNARRRANAARLRQLLQQRLGGLLQLPAEQRGFLHAYYTFPIVLPEEVSVSRRAFVEHLEAHGVETRPLFAGCLPDQPAFRRAPGRAVGSLPNARFLRDRLVFVGIHPALTARHIGYLADVIVAFFRRRAPRPRAARLAQCAAS